jgi:hypothetical protein
MSSWSTLADWLMVFGTLVLAAVALFQDAIRGWFYCPRFRVSAKTEPPDCVAVALTRPDSTFVADSIYLGLWVENVGNATARNAEVYANALQRERADGSWEGVAAFPPMNLKWAHLNSLYFPSIAPKMGKHCNIGHIVDPARRHLLPEEVPRLNLTDQQTTLAFEVVVIPNHKGHIVGPGKYRLEVLIAAENARPVCKTIEISLQGAWYPDQAQMLRDGVGMRIMPV